ncbi:MAG: amidohydrolase family protein, partial [Kurthia sp.]|nr:amidohydrolase family protein [Kurthia sp.]
MKKVWINGTIYTMESEGDTVEAVLTEDGRIIACGSTEDLKKEADEIIDLQGAVMYPGFVDSHLHMIGVGLQLMRLDLSSVQSKEEMLYLLTIASQNIPEDSWLIAEGF